MWQTSLQQDIYDKQRDISDKQQDIYNQQLDINDKSRSLMVRLPTPRLASSLNNQCVGIGGPRPS